MKCLGLVTLVVKIVIKGIVAADCEIPEYAMNLSQDHFLTFLTAPCRYDKHVLPESSMPLNVTVKVDVRHLEVEKSLTVQLMYEDQKLNYENFNTSRSIIFGDDAVKEKIWTPRIQLKDQNDTTIIDTKEEEVFVAINKNGLVTYSYKLVAKFYCWMDLKKFPFDTQKCTLSFSDWSYSNSQLKLRWSDIPPLVLPNRLRFTEFVIDEIEYTNGDNDGPYKLSSVASSVGDFSELDIRFKFHRDSGSYLFDFFLPSYLLVFTAWVTFWLQADAGPPRTTLGASTVVAFITLHLGMSKDIPKVSYIKASDIWFLGVSCFIFFSLAEFAFVNTIWRRKKVVELKKLKPKYIIKSALMPSKARQDLRRYESQISVVSATNNLDGYCKYISSVDKTATSFCNEDTPQFIWTTMTPQEVAIYVDRMARIIFPICFLIFNVVYWIYVYC